MTIFDGTVDLEYMRSKTKLTQADLATLLNISQPQVSRYEKSPDDIPAGLYRRWTAILGEVSGSQGMEIDDPRGEIDDRLALMASYVSVEPEISEGSTLQRDKLSGKNFMAGAKFVSRKQTVGVFGPYDAGKSRVLNTLLGGNRLPTSYQPMTSVMCLIRHVNDKPSWQVEDLWLYGKGFDFSKADDQEHCLAHKLAAGGAESLKQYGTHEGSGKDLGAVAAVLYVEAPILLAVDLMDAPGYGNAKDDDERAEMGQKLVDTLVYTSPINGFMDQTDANNVGALLRMLPVSDSGQFGPLDNVYFLCTHAHTVASPTERRKVLDLSAVRLAKNLELLLNDRGDRAGASIGAAELRQRFFTFSADNPEIRVDFEKAFAQHLTGAMPSLALKGLDQHVRSAKAEATGLCDREIRKLQNALNERDRAQAEVLAIEAAESVRQRKKAAHEKKIVDMIDNFSNETQAVVADLFTKRASVDAIESMIRNRYSDKKEAKESAASYLTNSIQQQLDSALKVRSNQLAAEVEGFLEEFQPAVDASLIKTSGFDFNARAAFMGAMTGMGTVGALAAWASIAAAGSNLGGYILAAQAVGWLSSIGISFGSSATVMGAIATMGGPVTLAIAAGVATAIFAFSLFGDSWQTKLAKKIHTGLIEHKAQSAMQEAAAKFWRDTKTAFTRATKQTESDYLARLASLRNLAFSTDREVLEKAIAEAHAVRDFFAGMPWRGLN